MRRRAPIFVAAAVLANLVAACGNATPSPSGAASAAAPSASTSIAASPAASGSSAASPAASVGSSLPPGSAPSPAIAIDPSLLDLLPAQLAGLDRQHDASLEAGDFSDPSLAGIATAGTTALYIDPTTAQFAFVALIRLKTAGLDDAQFRAWRDSFDAQACSQAGGVGGHAEATIGGHDTYIGTCAGGLTTYHTILGSRGLLVSVSSVGDQRLGEQLVSKLPS